MASTFTLGLLILVVFILYVPCDLGLKFVALIGFVVNAYFGIEWSVAWAFFFMAGVLIHELSYKRKKKRK
jgi:uncharacterized membrane protein